MFKSEVQLARVCSALCTKVGLYGMWTDEGPTKRSIELLERNGGPLSSGERVMLLCSWAVWNGSGDLTLQDPLHRLDPANLSMLGELFIAVAAGGPAIDEWLAKRASLLPAVGDLARRSPR